MIERGEDWFEHVASHLTLWELWTLRLVSKKMNTRLRSHWKWWQRAVAVEKEAGLDVYSPNTVEEANRLFRYGWRLLLEQTPGKRSDGRCHKCKCHLVSSRCPECSQKPSVFPCPRCGLLRWKTQRTHRACLSSKKRINHP